MYYVIEDYRMYARNAFYLPFKMDQYLVQMDKKEQKAQEEEKEEREQARKKTDQMFKSLSVTLSGGGLGALFGAVASGGLGALIGLPIGLATGYFSNQQFGGADELGDDHDTIPDKRYARLLSKIDALQQHIDSGIKYPGEFKKVRSFFLASAKKFATDNNILLLKK